jgi:hypothetical protein
LVSYEILQKALPDALQHFTWLAPSVGRKDFLVPEKGGPPIGGPEACTLDISRRWHRENLGVPVAQGTGKARGLHLFSAGNPAQTGHLAFFDQPPNYPRRARVRCRFRNDCEKRALPVRTRFLWARSYRPSIVFYRRLVVEAAFQDGRRMNGESKRWSFARAARKTAEDEGRRQGGLDVWERAFLVRQFVNSRLGAILLRAEGFKNP